MPDPITMTPDKDGWIKHNGDDKCPVDPDAWVQCDGPWYNWAEHAAPAAKWEWERVDRYRIFTPVASGPSPFVRDTAARIMAGFASHPDYMAYPHADWAAEAANAALALEAALKGATK